MVQLFFFPLFNHFILFYFCFSFFFPLPPTHFFIFLPLNSSSFFLLPSYNRKYHINHAIHLGRMLKMKQRISIPELSRRLKPSGSRRQWDHLLKQEWFTKTTGIVLSIFIGFLSAAAKLELGTTLFAPFGIAFAAAAMSNLSITREYGYAPAAGVVIGYVLTAGTMSNMKYLAALALMLAIRGFLSVSPSLKNSLFLPCAASALSIFFSCIGFSLLFGLTFYDAVLALCESCVAGGLAFFFLRAMAIPSSGFSPRSPSVRIPSITDSQSKACLIISAAILLIGLTSLEIAAVSLGRILGATAVMLCAFSGREGGGAIAGIAAGIACAAGSLSGDFLTTAPLFTLISVGFSLGGLLAGVFHSFGKLGPAISFVCVIAAGTALLDSSLLSPLIEACIGAVFFLMFPPSFIKYLTASENNTMIKNSRVLKELSVLRLELAASSLKDVADTTRTVTEKMKKLFAKDDISAVFSHVADRFCRGCYKNVRCWQADYNTTMDVFNHLAHKLKQDGRLSEKSLPEYFFRSCLSPERLINEINLEYSEFITQKSSDGKIAQVRSIVTDQFEAISNLLFSLARELTLIREAEPDTELLLFEAADKLLLSPLETSCFKDGSGRFSAELEIPEFKLARLDTAEFTAELCDLLGYDLTPPVIKTWNGAARLTFRERENFTLSYTSEQYSVSGETFCGDAIGAFTDTIGRTYILISDGMGSGRSASLDSSMAVGLLNRMLTAGFDADSALSMLNSAMLVKSGDESLATIDLACIDLFCGSVTFFKAGAAPSYIRRGDKVMRIEGTSMPAGILGGITFDKSTFSLKEGDLLLMCSDGIASDGNTDWIATEFEQRNSETLEDIAHRIIHAAKTRTIPGREDDISVVVMELRK